MPVPATDSTLFSADDLADLIGDDVSDERAALVESVVWGWLRGPLGLTERPNPIPDDVFAWAIELAATYNENPTGLLSYQLGEERSQYSDERRAQILIEAAADGSGATGEGIPQARFPRRQPDAYGFWLQ